MDINHFICTGRLTGDAESRQIGESTAFSFSVAVNHYEKKEKKEVGEFFPVELWGNSEGQANYYKSILTKGSQIVVEGRLSQKNGLLKKARLCLVQ